MSIVIPPQAIEDRIRAIFTYDPATGTLYRHFKSGSRPMKTLTKEGYIAMKVQVDYVIFQTVAHRLAWFLTHNEWAPQLDHINMDKADNRIANIRQCTSSQNRANASPPRCDNKSSKYKGVHLNHRRVIAGSSSPWHAYIYINNKRIHLGFHASEQAAAIAYNRKAVALFAEFARLNKVL